MSFVVIATTAGMTAEIFDEVMASPILAGRLPAGCSTQIAGPGEDGWKIVTVWDTAEHAQSFVEEVVRPILAQHGIAGSAGPPQRFPLHALRP